MRRRTQVIVQVLVIAGIHLLLYIAFLSLLKAVVAAGHGGMHEEVLLPVVTGIVVAFESPMSWLFMFLDQSGVHGSGAIITALIPVNSLIAAAIIRAVYARLSD